MAALKMVSRFPSPLPWLRLLRFRSTPCWRGRGTVGRLLPWCCGSGASSPMPRTVDRTSRRRGRHSALGRIVRCCRFGLAGIAFKPAVGDLAIICICAAQEDMAPSLAWITLRDSTQPEPTDARRGCSRTVGDEVHWGTVGPSVRRRHRSRHECWRSFESFGSSRVHRPARPRSFSRGARGENSGSASTASAGKCVDTRRAPRGPSQALSRFAEPPRTRGGPPAIQGASKR